jgi:alkanesulfonate monooxygenase SsuD/methylene tetrahydromethanopterin reductase-like flavin-dependent oxidoreductase (luciferase family)
MLTKMERAKRMDLFKADRNIPDDRVALDGTCNELVIWGSPSKVIDELLALREIVGDFGTLLYAGHDWRDPELARRSMVLIAEKVLPAVNAAIGKSRAAAE